MPDRRERACSAKRRCVVAVGKRASEIVQRSEAASRSEIGKERRAHCVAAGADLARQLPAGTRPARIGAGYEAPAEQCAANQIITRGRQASAEAQQRSCRDNNRVGVISRERPGQCAHQRNRAVERELRLLASEERTEPARAGRVGDRSLQLARTGNDAVAPYSIESWEMRRPRAARNRFETQLATADQRARDHHRARMQRRQPRADPDDIPVRLVPRRLRECGQRARYATAALERAARALANRGDPQPGALFCCCMPAIRQTTANNA